MTSRPNQTKIRTPQIVAKISVTGAIASRRLIELMRSL